MSKVRIALLQDKLPESRDAAIASAEERAAQAAAQGANIVCTQELFLGGYFCDRQDPSRFDLAEEVPGPATRHFQEVARKLGVVMVLSLFERRASGLFHNTAAIIDADGSFLGKYRKTHIPQDPFFEEKFYFSPGDTGFKAWSTKFGRIGVIVCWDQWFPESARLTALDGAQIILCPTAIGWLQDEKAALGRRQRDAWLTVQRGHAVANSCYYAAVNRVGVEGPIEFWGGSFVADFCGEVVAQGSASEPETVLADCDLSALESHRRIWPFFRDRRVDAYAPIARLSGNG